MMTQNSPMRTITWRCSDYLLAMVDAFCLAGFAASRQQAISYAVAAYLSRPIVYSKLDIKALREPMKNLVSTELSQSAYNTLSGFCASNSLTISEAIRMAVYQEVVQHDTEK